MIEGHERILLAAQGYSELGMFDDALAEIDSLPEEVTQHATVVEMRTVILMQARRWKRPAASFTRPFACMNLAAPSRRAIPCSPGPRSSTPSLLFTTTWPATN